MLKYDHHDIFPETFVRSPRWRDSTGCARGTHIQKPIEALEAADLCFMRRHEVIVQNRGIKAG